MEGSKSFHRNLAIVAESVTVASPKFAVAPAAVVAVVAALTVSVWLLSIEVP